MSNDDTMKQLYGTNPGATMSDNTRAAGVEKQDDGGPAFPARSANAAAEMELGGIDPRGMSLRDYFAAKAPMPNAAEASSIMGWRCRESVPRPMVEEPARDESYKAWAALPGFDELWKTLSNEERFRVCAKSQYMYADAMLKARAL